LIFFIAIGNIASPDAPPLFPSGLFKIGSPIFGSMYFSGPTVLIATIPSAPASTADTIMYLTLDAGDTLDSPGATGDSVHLVGGAATWYVVDTGSSAWSDGGAS